VVEELKGHRIRQVAIDMDRCLAVTEEGALFTWAMAPMQNEEALGDGNGVTPQLGLGVKGTSTSDFWPPHRVTALAAERVGSVAVRHLFTLVTTEAGSVFSFGVGAVGQLGHGDTEDQILPRRIEALDGTQVATIAAGESHSLALTFDGRVFCWGGSDDQVTLGLVPTLVDAPLCSERVQSIAARDDASFAVTEAGVLFSWCLATPGGFNLGHGNDLTGPAPRPVAALQGVTVVGVSPGDMHTFALAEDGSVYAFGTGCAMGLDPFPHEQLEIPTRIPGLVCSSVPHYSRG
jgi:E3 ubiquitin-protein ligase HERC2